MSAPPPRSAAGSRLTLPVLPAAERGGGFPIVASLAPLAAAAVIFAVTRSPFALLFAVAAPLAGLGGLLDRRIRRRRTERRTLESARRSLARLGRDVAAEHDRERADLDRSGIDAHTMALAPPAGLWRGGEPRFRIGYADLVSGVDLGEAEEVPAALVDEVRDLIDASRTIASAPLAVDAPSLGVVGPEPMRSAVLRALALQLCASVHPAAATLHAPRSEAWVRELPHRVRPGPPDGGWELDSGSGSVRWIGAASTEELPAGTRAIVHLADGDEPRVTVDGARVAAGRIAVTMIGAGTAEALARRLNSAVRAHERGSSLPDRVRLGDLLDSVPPSGSVLAAPIGADADGPFWVDLVRDGPHAVIGGTTGSGKSELLVSWVVGLAGRYPPDRVAFLLIDFKGGSAFAPLGRLPHVVGVVSDLDTATARRAVASLRSEVLRRERLIADAGAREIGAVAGAGRLVVVVDEYAALVAEQPELHELVADLASRGRSLGIHLVLCTQSPGGVIRDQVLANAGLRICLRVNNRADSIAVVGADDAAAIPAGAAGRAHLRDGSGGLRQVQCALASEDDAERAFRIEPGGAPPFRPWAEPLPALIRVEEVPRVGEGIPFGLVDLPEQQRIAPAAYAPERDGNLLIVGGRRAGTSTALATIAGGAGPRAVRVPEGVADAWAVLAAELSGGAPGDGRVLVVDDLDRLLDAADESERPGLVRLLAGLARELPVRGGALVAAASRVPGSASALLTRIDTRLILRLPDREQHVLAGGEAREWSSGAPPGRGWWHGREVQVAFSDPLPPPDRPRIEEHRIDASTAVVASDRRGVVARLAERGLAVVEPGGAPSPGRVVVGEPDDWTAAWSALESARRGDGLLLVGCGPGDLRALVRSHADPPPLDPRRAEGWLIRSRRPVRVRVPWLEGGPR